MASEVYCNKRTIEFYNKNSESKSKTAPQPPTSTTRRRTTTTTSTTKTNFNLVERVSSENHFDRRQCTRRTIFKSNMAKFVDSKKYAWQKSKWLRKHRWKSPKIYTNSAVDCGRTTTTMVVVDGDSYKNSKSFDYFNTGENFTTVRKILFKSYKKHKHFITSFKRKIKFFTKNQIHNDDDGNVVDKMVVKMHHHKNELYSINLQQQLREEKEQHHNEKNAQRRWQSKKLLYKTKSCQCDKNYNKINNININNNNNIKVKNQENFIMENVHNAVVSSPNQFNRTELPLLFECNQSSNRKINNVKFFTNNDRWCTEEHCHNYPSSSTKNTTSIINSGWESINEDTEKNSNHQLNNINNNTETISTQKNEKRCRRQKQRRQCRHRGWIHELEKSNYFMCRLFRHFYDGRNVLQTLLPILLLFNILPFLNAVASDVDVTVVGGPNPEPQPWIPVVAYLEPLPRPTKAPKCDQTFVSRAGGPTNGTFTAPSLQNPTNHSRQCLYIFLAGPGQRVEVVFTSFNLRGNPPDGAAVGELPACVHEYMDIYAEVQSSDPADLINSPFGGRYCGPIPPRRRISLYRALALSFYTIKNQTVPELFGGRYSFINESEYEFGTPVIGSPCSYTVNFAINRTGNIISPTYPGAYPKDMSCTYQFIGKSSQRVRIEFRDFDLFFGGPHCPFDFVKVYDGPDNSSGLIGTYCGQQRNLVLYSSESSLFIHFSTLQRTANTQNRGFRGIYEFSESFVKLDFIRENAGEHIRGSECDQKILSRKKSSGFVYSPNYPFPYMPKVVCRYFIYGMQDAQHLERVRLDFQMVEIPKGPFKADTNCSDGYLKVYLKGQETTDSYDKFDYELCGIIPQLNVVSDGPRLVMVFSSGDALGRGFKGRYSFETEYKIPGTAAPDGTCSFTYRSSSRKKGEFNSPRYPSNYPSETNCSYVFLATPNEQVVIVFDHFKVKANTSGIAYGSAACYEDWLELYVLFRDKNDRFLGRYCGMTAPGPVESPRGSAGIRVVLHTDQENVASGFKARYVFEVAKSVFGDCGGNFTGLDSGVITSPSFPENYEGPGKGLASKTCNWFITARLGYKLSINSEIFSVEGDPASRGCPAAVLRIWTALDSDAAPVELCGERNSTSNFHYISQGQSARISFTTTDKTIGAQGFRVVWTEVQDAGLGPPTSLNLMCESTYHFHCSSSGYCIADKLKCDGIHNCGPGDDSDEMHCTPLIQEEDHGALIISSIAGGSFLICLLCTLCHRKRKRRHHRQLGLHRNAGHYDSTTSATGLGSSRRHLQSGGSLSGSLHGLHTDNLPIPPAPLPPTSVPPHVCITGADMMDDDDEDDDDDDGDDDNLDHHHDHDPDHNLFGNGDRFSSGDSV